MRRKLFSIFLGLFAGFLVYLVCHLINSAYHPLPADLDVHNKEEFRKAMSMLPRSYFVGNIYCFFLAVTMASFVSSLMRGYAWLTGAFVPTLVFLVLASVVLFALPHPDWFAIPYLSIIFLAGLCGYGLAALLLGTTQPCLEPLTEQPQDSPQTT